MTTNSANKGVRPSLWHSTQDENRVAQASLCRAGQATTPGGHGDAPPTSQTSWLFSKGTTCRSTRATGQFGVKSWDEEPYDKFGDEAKLTRASVTQTFSGDIEGEGTVEYLMMYSNEAFACFIGQQRIVGHVGGRSGSFVLHLSGTFDGSKAEATWSVVPGSATGELRGMRGEGNFSVPLGKTASVTLDYKFE